MKDSHIVRVGVVSISSVQTRASPTAVPNCAGLGDGLNTEFSVKIIPNSAKIKAKSSAVLLITSSNQHKITFPAALLFSNKNVTSVGDT